MFQRVERSAIILDLDAQFFSGKAEPDLDVMFPVIVVTVTEDVGEMFLQCHLDFVQFPIREIVGGGELLQLILPAGDFGRPVAQGKVKLLNHAQRASCCELVYFSTNSGKPVISRVAATSAEGRVTSKVKPLPFIWR